MKRLILSALLVPLAFGCAAELGDVDPYARSTGALEQCGGEVTSVDAWQISGHGSTVAAAYQDFLTNAAPQSFCAFQLGLLCEARAPDCGLANVETAEVANCDGWTITITTRTADSIIICTTAAENTESGLSPTGEPSCSTHSTAGLLTAPGSVPPIHVQAWCDVSCKGQCEGGESGDSDGDGMSVHDDDDAPAHGGEPYESGEPHEAEEPGAPGSGR